MEENKQHLEALVEIRAMMEKSTKFISLSGLSGVAAGVFGLIGAIAAYIYLEIDFSSDNYYDYAYRNDGTPDTNFFTFFFINGLSVLTLALTFGIYFTSRKAKKNNQKIWNSSSKRLLGNLLLPLITGGVFCLILFYHGLIGLIAPATLIFYGLALINAGKYTLHDIQYLGVFEIILGLFASIYIGYGLLFWALGFGVLHIIYGTLMYFKYEK
ncbi:MAG: hypothetical protein FGM14_13020 [Flavobacteriales bacterium]|nr:hypothetical protein [Flavobacteriales bacterium]